MKFFIGIVILVILCLAGLFVYGQALEPETRIIEIEVEAHETTSDE